MSELLLFPLPAVARASLGLAAAAILMEIAIRISRLRSASAAQALWFLVLAQGLVLVTIGVPVAPAEHVVDGPAAASVPPRAFAPATDLGPPRLELSTEAGTGIDEHPAAVAAREGARPEWGAPAVRRVPWRSVLAFLWGAGMVLLTATAATRYVLFARQVLRARPGRADWQAEWQELLAANGVRRDVPLSVDERIGPVLCRLPAGCRLVVPDPLWSELSPAERRAVLLHELAHLRRGDLWLSFAAGLLVLPHWFNPFAWWAYFRLERCAEWACDEAAAAAAGRTVYARALMRLGSSGRFTAALSTSARGGRLFGRIRRVLTERTGEDRRMKQGLLIALACCLLAAAGLRLEPRMALGQPAGADDNAEAAPDDSLPEGALVRLGSDRLRHRSDVRRVAYSPDGRLIAASGVNYDAGVHLWDAQDGRHVRHLNRDVEEFGYVDTFAFAPDGQSLVAAWSDESLTLWAVSTGRLRWRLARGEIKARSVAFAPDSTSIAVGGPDGSVVLRRADDGSLIRQIAPAVERIVNRGAYTRRGAETVLAFSRDGSRLVRGVKTPPSIRVFDPTSGDLVSKVEQAHGEALQWLTVAPDGKRIVSTGWRQVPRENLEGEHRFRIVNIAEIRVWNIETGQPLEDVFGESVGHSSGYAALAPDGQTFALAVMGGLRLWNPQQEERVREIELPGWWGGPPAFSPDGRRVAAGVGNTIAIWDAANGERLLNGDVAHEEMVGAVAYSPDGRSAITAGGGTVHLWDTRSGRQRLVRRLGREALVYDAAFTPDGRLFLAAGAPSLVPNIGGVARLWDVETGDLVREITTGEQDRIGGAAKAIAVSPDSQRLAIAEERGLSLKIQLWDITSGRRLATYPPGDDVVSWASDLRFSPDGRYLWSAGLDSRVHRWDTQGDDHLTFVADRRPPDERGPDRGPHVSQAIFTPDARTLVTVSNRRVLHFWDTETGELRSTLELPEIRKGAEFRLSPNGRTLVDVIYAGERGEDDIVIWDVPSKTRRMVLRPQNARAISFAFSPDGRQLLTGLERGMSLIWRIEPGD